MGAPRRQLVGLRQQDRLDPELRGQAPDFRRLSVVSTHNCVPTPRGRTAQTAIRLGYAAKARSAVGNRASNNLSGTTKRALRRPPRPLIDFNK
eukprot:GDKH01007558.1.p1 GENE.GDKH01007558.1~~GDKH01007558.1.p1  ORF type:complete len:93 (+),score=8.66 GDKH01007558.1:1-279(+)